MHVFRDKFMTRFPSSLAKYRQAMEIFPGGVTHDSRFMSPFPVYMSHGQGAHKWDLDGNRFIDYWIGHGALILGHNHPAVVQALQAQLAKGMHLGGSHELEVEWGRRVKQLVPSAEQVRFVSSEVASGEPQAQAGCLTLKLIDGMNDIVRRQKIDGCVYGDKAAFHLFLGRRGITPDDADHILHRATTAQLASGTGEISQTVRAALILEGVDPSGSSGRLSSTHTAADVDDTLSAFERAIENLKRESIL